MNRLRALLLLPLVLLLGSMVAIPLRAQTTNAPDPLLDRLIGRWVLQGRMAGKQVTHDVSSEWRLGNEYVELHEISRERTANGSPAYEAIVYLGRDPRTHEYAVLWLDNTDYGGFDPAGTGHGKAAGDSIPFLFRYSETTRFHNTFVYDRQSDSWQWHLDNDSAGVLKPFARVTLTRAR